MSSPRSVLLVHGLWSSARTWWRVGPELEARGWQVDTVSLAGHGGRPIGAVRSLAGLAQDVAARRPDRCTVVVGHSLGAVVALELLAAVPAYAAGVLLEDPPGRGDGLVRRDRAEDLLADGERAREDPDGVIASLLLGHPTWSRRDARSVLEGRLLSDPSLTRLPRDDLGWHLPRLVSDCPVPVGLVACRGRYSALAEPERSAVRQLIPPERVTELPGSHHVHLDEPARWVAALEAFAASLPASPAPGPGERGAEEGRPRE